MHYNERRVIIQRLQVRQRNPLDFRFIQIIYGVALFLKGLLFILAGHVNVRLRLDSCCHALVTQIFLIRTMVIGYTLWGDFDNARGE